jgi:hypothetical protein
MRERVALLLRLWGENLCEDLILAYWSTEMCSCRVYGNPRQLYACGRAYWLYSASTLQKSSARFLCKEIVCDVVGESLLESSVSISEELEVKNLVSTFTE